MDSGRFILAVVLMIAVILTTNILFPSSPPHPAARADSVRADSILKASGNATVTAATDTTTKAAAPSQAVSQGATAVPDSAAPRTPAATTGAPARTVFVESGIYRYGFSTHGGSLVAAQMLKHASHAAATNGKPADLVEPGPTPLIAYKVIIGNRAIDLSTLDFRAIPENGVRVDSAGGAQLRLIHTDSAQNFEVEIDYDFRADTYVIDTHASVRNIGDQPAKLRIAMGPTLAQTEADSAEDARHRAYVLNGTTTGIRDVTMSRFTRAGTEQMENGPFSWVALRNKYFVSAILEAPTNGVPFGGVLAKPVPGRLGAQLNATLLPGSDGRFAFRIYVGPQEPKLLVAVGDGFKDVNPFGWRWARPILRPVGHGIAALLYGMHDLFGIGYGWVLILFGVLIRVLLWPLNAKAMRSQMKSMEIQPRVKEIQTRYKGDPEKMQKEMLKLYKEEGFNPMGGCLPTLIPFPILITLYFVFANAIAFRGVGFLWMPDLSRPDPLYILPVLLGLSMFVLQWFSTRTAVGDQNQQMKVMMYTMPPFMTFIFLRFAAGLNLYYAAMNLASIPQQIQIMRERQRMRAASAKM